MSSNYDLFDNISVKIIASIIIVAFTFGLAGVTGYMTKLYIDDWRDEIAVREMTPEEVIATMDTGSIMNVTTEEVDTYTNVRYLYPIVGESVTYAYELTLDSEYVDYSEKFISPTKLEWVDGIAVAETKLTICQFRKAKRAFVRNDSDINRTIAEAFYARIPALDIALPQSATEDTWQNIATKDAYHVLMDTHSTLPETIFVVGFFGLASIAVVIAGILIVRRIWT